MSCYVTSNDAQSQKFLKSSTLVTGIYSLLLTYAWLRTNTLTPEDSLTPTQQSTSMISNNTTSNFVFDHIRWSVTFLVGDNSSASSFVSSVLSSADVQKSKQKFYKLLTLHCKTWLVAVKLFPKSTIVMSNRIQIKCNGLILLVLKLAVEYFSWNASYNILQHQLQSVNYTLQSICTVF